MVGPQAVGKDEQPSPSVTVRNKMLWPHPQLLLAPLCWNVPSSQGQDWQQR